jgi:hypothetical protein
VKDVTSPPIPVSADWACATPAAADGVSPAAPGLAVPLDSLVDDCPELQAAVMTSSVAAPSREPSHVALRTDDALIPFLPL